MNDEWWRGAVTYQIYPRSFQDSDGDGIGDLPGITRRLGYVADLGVDAVWLSPIYPSPMADMGYDVSDHCGVDPIFGTLADFDALVAEAHRLGLKLILDQVINHTARAHPLFQESREGRANARADWFVWADPRADGSPPNNWQSVFGGSAWEWEPRRLQYYFHNFMTCQPDLNYHHPEVQDWALDTLRFWLDRGVDGFRLDTVNFYFHDKALRDDAADYRVKAKPAFKPYDMQYHLFSKNQPENLVFLQRIRHLLDGYGARTSMGEVGEDHHPIEVMAEYTRRARLHSAYSFQMLSDDFGAAHFRHQVVEFFRTCAEGWPAWSFSNHDVPRHASRWAAHGADPEALAKLCAVMLLSLEGSICLYQGEELGQTQTDLAYDELVDPQGLSFWPEDKGRDGTRTPMVWESRAAQGGFTDGIPWLPLKDPQRAHAVDLQAGVAGSVHGLYREALALRRAEPSLRTGRTTFLDLPEPVMAFRRGDDLTCAFNLGPDAVDLPLEGRGEPLLALDATWEGGRLRLGPNGALIARHADRHDPHKVDL